MAGAGQDEKSIVFSACLHMHSIQYFTFLQSGRSAEMGRCPGGVQQDMQGLYNKKNNKKNQKQAALNH